MEKADQREEQNDQYEEAEQDLGEQLHGEGGAGETSARVDRQETKHAERNGSSPGAETRLSIRPDIGGTGSSACTPSRSPSNAYTVGPGLPPWHHACI